MPQQIPYSVKFPDGHVQEFTGPDDLSDADAFARATQERAIASGKIQTTWFGGAAKQMGQEKGATEALIGGAGMLTGVAPVVAAAPLAATWLAYATKKFTGEDPPLPTTGEQAVDAVSGVAAGYGGQLLEKSGSAIAKEVGNLRVKTLPQAIARASSSVVEPITDGIGKLKPSAVNATLQEAVQALENAGIRTKAGLSSDEVDLMRESVAKGMKPATAARIIGNSPAKFNALMKLYMRPAAGLVK